MAPNLEHENGHTNESFAADEDSLDKKDETSTESSISSGDDGSKKKDKKKKKKKGKKEEDEGTIPGLPPVSYFALFRYASGMDKFLIFLAVLASCGTGICFPIMLVLFGDVTNAFVGGGLNDTMIHELNCYLANNPNATVNITS